MSNVKGQGGKVGQESTSQQQLTSQQSAGYAFRKGLAETLRNIGSPQTQQAAPPSAQHYGQRPPESRGTRQRAQTGKSKHAPSHSHVTDAMAEPNLFNTGTFDEFNASSRYGERSTGGTNLLGPAVVEPEERNNFTQVFSQTS